jgi:aromatic ring-cleaving dioxygenase
MCSCLGEIPLLRTDTLTDNTFYKTIRSTWSGVTWLLQNNECRNQPHWAFATVGLATPGEARECWLEFRKPIRRSPVMSDAPAVYGYHAHVYYDAATLPVAEKLKAELGARFDVELGPNSGERVGPHPIPQFQMIFKNEQFQTVVPWLMLNREGLDILIHPLTDDMVDDHTVYALWLGMPVKLVLDRMRRRGYPEALLPKAA